jgi:hypothetical protein
VPPQPQVANEEWVGPEGQDVKGGRPIELERSMEGGR